MRAAPSRTRPPVTAQQPQLLQAQSLPHWQARAAALVFSIIVSLLFEWVRRIGLTAF
jgi:hypothetical protein